MEATSATSQSMPPEMSTSIEDCIIRLPNVGIPLKLHIPNTAKFVLEYCPVRTLVNTGEIYYYYEGVYRKNGDKFLRRELVREFGDYLNPSSNPLLSKIILVT
jgi:hypothetical protein